MQPYYVAFYCTDGYDDLQACADFHPRSDSVGDGRPSITLSHAYGKVDQGFIAWNH